MQIGQSWSDSQARSGGGLSPVFRPYLHHSSQPTQIVLPPWIHPASPPALSSAEAALSLPAHPAAPEAVTIRHTFHSTGCPQGAAAARWVVPPFPSPQEACARSRSSAHRPGGRRRCCPCHGIASASRAAECPSVSSLVRLEGSGPSQALRRI